MLTCFSWRIRFHVSRHSFPCCSMYGWLIHQSEHQPFLMDPLFLQTSDPRIQAVGTTTGQLNTKLEAITTSFSAGSIDANTALSQIGQIVRVAQAQVAPAVAQLLGPTSTLTVQAFQQAYSGDALTSLVAQ